MRACCCCSPTSRIVREEIVTVTKNSHTEDNDDLYEGAKAHSDQISRLTNIVESLQSQIKQIDQRRTSGSSKPKNRSTTKTKKSKTTSKKSKGKRALRESKEFKSKW
jgi:hypothetical protein